MTKNIIIIELYFMLILIKTVSADTFIDIKKLSFNNDYFVILDNGLYLYDSNFKHCALIYEFNKSEYNNIERNKINLTELYHENKAYIFCLVNEYLFIFNEYSNQTLCYKINEISSFGNDDCCNILPYNIENNNINFIIAFDDDTNGMYFYFYNFNINEQINTPVIKKIDFENYDEIKMIRCEIYYNSTFIICFYYSKHNEENHFSSSVFLIDDMNLNLYSISGQLYQDEIKQIKLAISYDNI